MLAFQGLMMENSTVYATSNRSSRYMEYLKVSSKSSPASVAGAIAGMIKDGNTVEIQAVGAGAVNQSIKAIAIARGFLIPTGHDVWCTPAFQDIEINGEQRTAIRISVRPRSLDAGSVCNASDATSASLETASTNPGTAAASLETAASSSGPLAAQPEHSAQSADESYPVAAEVR